MTQKPSANPAGYYIFRPWRKLPDGTIDYAKDHGKKAFKIWISSDRERKPKAA